MCLGHVVEDLKTLDFTMNSNSIEPLPRNVRVFSTRMVDFRWEDARSQEHSVNMGASAPVAAAAGVTLGGDIKLAFSKSVESHEEYERLDKYIMQPTQSYITDCLDEEPFASYTKGKITWSLFMVTGLCVARKGTSSASDSSSTTVGMGIESGIATIADARVGFENAHESSRVIEGTHSDDFVWAVRFAKIHKGFLQRDWSVSTYTKRATFNAKEDEVNVAAVLSEEGVVDFTVVEDDALDQAFVI